MTLSSAPDTVISSMVRRSSGLQNQAVDGFSVGQASGSKSAAFMGVHWESASSLKTYYVCCFLPKSSGLKIIKTDCFRRLNAKLGHILAVLPRKLFCHGRRYVGFNVRRHLRLHQRTKGPEHPRTG